MGRLVVCPDLKIALERILNEIGDAPRVIFEKDDFQIEDAHELIAQAYIASEREKFLIACAGSFNTVTQNALLKLLEEPPRNCAVVLIAPRKSIFLPTIRSRLPITTFPATRAPSEGLIDFSRLDLAAVYGFLKSNAYLDRDRAKRIVEDALNWYSSQKSASEPLNGRILSAIERAFRLLSLNTPSGTALTPLLLILLEIKDGAKTSR